MPCSKDYHAELKGESMRHLPSGASALELLLMLVEVPCMHVPAGTVDGVAVGVGSDLKDWLVQPSPKQKGKGDPKQGNVYMPYRARTRTPVPWLPSQVLSFGPR